MIPDLKGPLYKEKCEKFAKNIAPFSLVLAISIHIVTAWIFATQGSRDWWHTSILAPDFINTCYCFRDSFDFINFYHIIW